MTDDELDDSDPKLKQLRAVWLSMRDEQPSERGLDALLAAARDKADAMRGAETAPSWWQRFTAVMRRPPVLALASAVVLIGGAVVVIHKRDASSLLEPRPTQAPTQSEAPGAAPQVPAAGPEAPRTQQPSAESVSEPLAPDPRADRPSRSVPAKSRRLDKSSEAARPRSKPAVTTPPAPPPPPPAVQTSKMPPAVGEMAGPSDGGSQRENTVAPSAAKEHAPGSSAVRSRDDAPTTKGADADADVGAGTNIDELVKHCERAAVRGDCASVRSLAVRIEKLDANVYKARVRANQTIRRCLEAH
ncbi:MAG: hypothetical protein AB7P03_29275 [Kofleriaceae bacterium]